MAVCGGEAVAVLVVEGRGEVKLGWGSCQMERWGRREGGGSKGYAEWYLQCAGCEACHLSSNRKPVCGWNGEKKPHTFPSLLTLAAICTHRVTGPIADSSSAVPVCPCVSSQRCSVTCQTCSYDAISHNCVIWILTKPWLRRWLEFAI